LQAVPSKEFKDSVCWYACQTRRAKRPSNPPGGWPFSCRNNGHL